MRVGYVTGCYPRATDTFIQREVAGVRAAGVEVRTFAVRRPDLAHLVGEEQRTEYRSTEYLLPASVLAVLRGQLGALIRSPTRFAETIKLAAATCQPGVRGVLLQLAYLAEAGLLARLARKGRLDHLHNHLGDSSGTVTMLAARLSNLPFSMTVHGPDIFSDRSRWRLDEKAQRASFVACISDFARSQLMTVAPVDCWKRLVVVHCGVDPAAYDAPVVEADGFRLLSVGRLEQVKGLPILLDAVSSLKKSVPKLRLDIVGDGPDRAALESYAHSRGVADIVRFWGYQNQHAVRERLRQADVFVSASLAEGLPVVFMEALAARVPVVATRIMGVPELVEDGVVGRLVPPGDAGALASALRSLAELGPHRRRAMGEAGRRRVQEQFDVKVEAARLAELYRGAVRPSRNKRKITAVMTPRGLWTGAHERRSKG